MRLMQAGNKAPLANANVLVYYWPFNPPGRFAPPVMATARTSARGRFSVRLNTSMVPRTGLADVGSGPRAFNTLVFALAPSRQVVIWHQVMQLGRATSATASALTDPATGAPELAALLPHHRGSPPGDAIVIGHSFRWVPVLAMNSAPGMHTVFTYTFDQSTAKQTMAEAADSLSESFGTFGPFGVGGGETEMTDRSNTRHAKITGTLHDIVWAYYKFLEYDWLTCPHERPCVEYHEWDIDHWQGSLVLKNPDKKCVKFTGRGRHRHCVRKKKIGIVKYKVPHFTYCAGSCVTTLTSFAPDFIKNSVNTQVYSWQLNVAGFLTLGAQSAYGSITSVTWNRRSGCGGGRMRVLWGHNTDPVSARILQAACRKLP